jgi:hypothetical protein
MGTTHVMNAGLVPLAASTPALVAAAGARASYRFFEFFTAQIRNPNTRFETCVRAIPDRPAQLPYRRLGRSPRTFVGRDPRQLPPEKAQEGPRRHETSPKSLLAGPAASQGRRREPREPQRFPKGQTQRAPLAIDRRAIAGVSARPMGPTEQ